MIDYPWLFGFLGGVREKKKGAGELLYRIKWPITMDFEATYIVFQQRFYMPPL